MVACRSMVPTVAGVGAFTSVRLAQLPGAVSPTSARRVVVILGSMWQISAIAALLIVAYIGYLSSLLLNAPKPPATRGDEDHGVGDAAAGQGPPPLPQRSLGMVVVGLVLALIAVGVAVMAAIFDHGEPRYAFMWMAALPIAGALVGIAQLLVLLSVPKELRSPSIEPFVWLLGLGLLGVGACYGSLVL